MKCPKEINPSTEKVNQWLTMAEGVIAGWRVIPNGYRVSFGG